MMKKKVNGNWDIIKNGHSEYDTLHTSKPKKVKRGSICYETVTSKLTEEEGQWHKNGVIVIFNIN